MSRPEPIIVDANGNDIPVGTSVQTDNHVQTFELDYGATDAIRAYHEVVKATPCVTVIRSLGGVSPDMVQRLTGAVSVKETKHIIVCTRR